MDQSLDHAYPALDLAHKPEEIHKSYRFNNDNHKCKENYKIQGNPEMNNEKNAHREY